jgi:hypothetical protein
MAVLLNRLPKILINERRTVRRSRESPFPIRTLRKRTATIVIAAIAIGWPSPSIGAEQRHAANAAMS